MFKKAQEKTDAVSPVIGVILLVAVTVALVALATVIVFDIGSDVSDTADATVQLEQTPSGVQATIVRNENVESFSLVDNGDAGAADVTAGLSSVGDSATIDVTAETATNSETSGSVAVIANLSGGNSEVLTSTDYDYVAP
jgi:flagellin-like protein